MDGKVYYQPIVIDTETGTYSPIRDGIKFKTAWEAEDKLPRVARQMEEQEAHLHLGVQEVRSTPMPGHKPVSDYKQGA